jgi:hypothetical protein
MELAALRGERAGMSDLSAAAMTGLVGENGIAALSRLTRPINDPGLLLWRCRSRGRTACRRRRGSSGAHSTRRRSLA